MVFSTNQVRQFYVVKSLKGDANKTNGTVTGTSDAGTMALKLDARGKNLYLQYMGADNLMRSDIINIDNIICAKAIGANGDAQKHAMRKAVVKLDLNVNGGDVIPGQDYILRICINPYVGMSDEEPYFKHGAVHAFKGMKTGQFYTKLAASLYKNFSRELGKIFEFSINDSVVDRVKTDTTTGNETLIGTNGKPITVEDTYTGGVTITEVEQEWILGVKEQTFVNFDVIPTTVTYDGEEVKWGTVEYSNTTTVRNNGRKIADLEYFCMGERGDQYRNIGWPNVIKTTYLVDPIKPYYIFEIHYAYVGPNEGPQRSEKDITIAFENKADINKFIGQFETASGKTVTVNPSDVDTGVSSGTALK